MKKLIVLITFCSAFAAHAGDLQILDCKLKDHTLTFTPSASLTKSLKKQVKGAVVYKVKTKEGKVDIGSPEDLAVVNTVSSKNLAVIFFQQSQGELEYSYNILGIDLAAPVLNRTKLTYKAEFSEIGSPSGTCNFKSIK